MDYNEINSLLGCPVCREDLDARATEYECTGCNRAFPIRYGIPDFRLEPDPYISIERENAKIDGFYRNGRTFEQMLAAYYALTPESPPVLHSRYISSMHASEARGAGIVSKISHLYPDTRHTTFLDVGCGTGGLTIAAMKSYATVIGVDVALRWLVMGRQRLAEEGIDAPFICANAESLPFREKVFDAAAADAVIEHVNDSEQMRDEVLRVLQPGAPWFFVTNNRFSVLPEPHVRLWGFGFLPRPLMETVSRLVRRTPYRARLHSRRELRELFKGKGKVMLPYYSPGELGEKNEFLRKTWELLSRSAVVRETLGAVVPQYFVAGRKDF